MYNFLLVKDMRLWVILPRHFVFNYLAHVLLFLVTCDYSRQLELPPLISHVCSKIFEMVRVKVGGLKLQSHYM